MRKILNITLVLFTVLSIISCSDTWDEHYHNGNKGLSYDGSLLDYLKSHEELSDFAQLVKETGFDRELEIKTGQFFTLMAPVNGTFDKEMYLDMINDGRKGEVIKSFIKNHITLMDVSYSPDAAAKSIRMCNAKMFSMTPDAHIGDASIISDNIKCRNGIIYTLDNSLPFQPNIYEKIEIEHNKWLAEHPEANEQEEELISLYTFLSKYNQDSLDVAHSISRDYDENGNPIYVDSVMIRNNSILVGLDAMIYDEDSNYTAIIPSVSAFQERYNEAKSFLNYNPYIDSKNNTNLCDSLQKYFATSFAMSDMFYNMNVNKYPQDSVVSTTYNRLSDWQNHVYYNPFNEDGIFSGYNEKFNCSNGTVYMYDKYPLSVTDQFFKKKEYLCYNLSNLSSETTFTKNIITDYERFVLLIQNGNNTYAEHPIVTIAPSKPSVSPHVGINITNNLSATYDIYMVYSPNWLLSYPSYESAYETAMADSLAYDDGKGDISKINWRIPIQTTRFRALVYERDDAGKYPSSSKSYALKPATGDKFETRVTNVVDTLYLGSYTFNHAYYDSNEQSQLLPTGAVLQIQVDVTTKEFNNYLYSRNLYLNKIILVPRVEEETESDQILTVKQR